MSVHALYGELLGEFHCAHRYADLEEIAIYQGSLKNLVMAIAIWDFGLK